MGRWLGARDFVEEEHSWPCAAGIGIVGVGYFAYDLATGGAERIAESAGRIGRGEPTTGDLFAIGSLVGGVGAGGNIARTAISGASRSTALLNAERMTTVDAGLVLGTGISLPVRVAGRELQPIAVGLSRSANHRPGLVGRFADKVGAVTYWDLSPGALPSNAEIVSRMTTQFGQRQIMVNLSGLTQVEQLGINSGLRAISGESFRLSPKPK